MFLVLLVEYKHAVYIRKLEKGLPKRNASHFWISFQHLIFTVINALFCCSDWERRHTSRITKSLRRIVCLVYRCNHITLYSPI